jgi:hypothetical protein
LPAFWRVYAKEANAIRPQIDGIAINHPHRAFKGKAGHGQGQKGKNKKGTKC